MFRIFGRMHNGVTGIFDRWFEAWLPGLMARFTFAAVLFFYFFNSAKLKVGDGLEGYFQVELGAFAQMLPKAMEANGYDPSALSKFPYHVFVYAGTYLEFVLPVLIIVGLFTRFAALGMIVFIVVQSVVDITGHNAIEETVGVWFDRIPDSAILDQRLLWVFLLLYLVIYGAGQLSLDRFFAPRRRDF